MQIHYRVPGTGYSVARKLINIMSFTLTLLIAKKSYLKLKHLLIVEMYLI